MKENTLVAEKTAELKMVMEVSVRVRETSSWLQGATTIFIFPKYCGNGRRPAMSLNFMNEGRRQQQKNATSAPLG